MHKDQFTATGPANTDSGHSRTAFSNNTQSNQSDDDFTYGVNVQGSLCGVYGESLQNGRGSVRQTTEDNVGVWGAGERFGVMGEALGEERGIAGVCGSNNGSNNGVLGLGGPKGVGVVGLSLNTNDKLEKVRTITLDFEADGDTIGVLGASGTGIGVAGTSGGGEGVRGDSNDGVGVGGRSDAGTGVVGSSGTGIGVIGGSVSNAGVFGSSIEGDGVLGASTSGPGVSASSQNTTGVSASSERGDAVVAQAKKASGLIAVSGGSGNGVVAFSEGGNAVLAVIPRPTGNATTGGRARFAGRFIGPVQVEGHHQVLLDQIVYGNLVVLGRKSAAVSHPDGSQRLLYSIESPESWFEDFGEGKLTNGRAEVILDPDFAAVIKTGKYHVFVTPYGNSNGLYVTHRSSKGFRVQEQNGGNSNVRFSYRVVAKRKGIKVRRMARVTLPERPESESPKLLRRLKSLAGKKQPAKARNYRGGVST